MAAPQRPSARDFAARVAHLRRTRNLTQPELAELAGVSLRQVQRWEAGEGVPHPRNTRSLANALKVEIDELEPRRELPTRQGRLDRIELRLAEIEVKLDHLLARLPPRRP
jgi:transcriptional regulator with XRE-family HTH domain